MKIKEDLESTLLWKKKEGLILFPLQIHKGTDLEIQSSVRRASDKQERDDERQEKKRQTQAVQWLQSGTGDQSPVGRGLTGICCAGLF